MKSGTPTAKPTKVVTLTTDFGLQDWFVGTMKGVILGIAPDVSLVDITHDIAPGNIRAGAFALKASYRFFPRGAVHVAVVDPGVGGERLAIAVQTERYFFIGPDNGVLSWALAGESVRAIHALDNAAYLLDPVSQTFHGRDLFAPAAAHLSRGLSIAKLGRPRDNLVRLVWPEAKPAGNEMRAEVLYIDRFGNAITNVTAGALGEASRGAVQVFRGGKVLCRLVPSYQAVPTGQALAVVGSSGLLEIALNGGSAADQLELRVGDTVQVRIQTTGKEFSRAP